MIKTVVFDIGRVLLGFEWEDYTSRIFAGRLTTDEVEIVNKATFNGPFWKEQDRGVMDTSDIHSAMMALAPGYEVYVKEAMDRVGECIEHLDYAIPWIKDVKSRELQVLYLSNYSEYVSSKSVHALDFLPHMDGGIMSWKEKCIKPDEKIYKALFEKYNLLPEECVFIDDSNPNIEMASRLGMKTIRFEGYEQARTDLNNIIG